MDLKFITCETAAYDKKHPPFASYLRKDITIRGGLLKAVLHFTALGVTVPFINGERVTEARLLPGYTDYFVRVQYHSCDVTALVKPGVNTVAAILGEGWYRGTSGPFSSKAVFGKQTGFACRLELTYADGTETFDTGDDWLGTMGGPLMDNDLKMIERYDARREAEGWNKPGFDAGAWTPCRVFDYVGQVVPAESKPVLPHESFSPSVLHTPDGSTVLDFGQNFAGFLRFTVTGIEGQTVSIKFGEALSQEGNFTLQNLQGSDKDTGIMTLGQQIVYTLKDGTQTYEPYFLTCGFRYCKLIDWPEEVRPENFTAYAIYTDIPFVGKFRCSDPDVERLVENVRWSMKSNFVDIPTDCPQRERAGWTGDINVFIECANWFADTRGIIGKWMRDLVAVQAPNGCLPYIVPRTSEKSNEKCSAGWTDAIITIPMSQREFYGENDTLETSYEAAKRYVEYNIARAAKKSLLHIFRRGEDEKYILDTGFHFGEWLEPGAANLEDAAKAVLSPDEEVATAWFFYAVKLLSEGAAVLGKTEDAEKYGRYAENVRAAYRRHFIPGGKINSKRQCKYVRPLYMGLASDDEKAGIAAALNELCVKNTYRIGTGFLTTYQILNVLSDNGYADTAYRMLKNRECPGWMYEIDKGATTIWEGWDAVDPVTGKYKAKSLNHYAPGAAVSWLFTRCCGIRPAAPGFESVEISPVPGGELTYARAEYDSVRGKIVSGWSIENGKFVLTVAIPDGVKATVRMPDGRVFENAVSGKYE